MTNIEHGLSLSHIRTPVRDWGKYQFWSEPAKLAVTSKINSWQCKNCCLLQKTASC